MLTSAQQYLRSRKINKFKRLMCAAHIAPAAQLYVCSDAGCTAVRVDSSGVYTCMEGVISPVQLYGSSDTVCTRVHAVYTKKSSLFAP